MSERYSPFTPDMVAVQTDFRSTLFPEENPKTPPPPPSMTEEKPVLSSQSEDPFRRSISCDPEIAAYLKKLETIEKQRNETPTEDEWNTITDDTYPAYLLGRESDPSLSAAPSPTQIRFW